jgi:hypothetical protein
MRRGRLRGCRSSVHLPPPNTTVINMRLTWSINRGIASGAWVLARAGATAQAQQLNHELAKQFPLDTLVQNYWLPSLRAEVEVQKSNPLHAIELLQPAHDYEMADPLFLRSEG